MLKQCEELLQDRKRLYRKYKICKKVNRGHLKICSAAYLMENAHTAVRTAKPLRRNAQRGGWGEGKINQFIFKPFFSRKKLKARWHLKTSELLN
jgi:hypothetical protein